jgi:glycosyltransferase involved in cell wall biosynthesis
MVTTFYPPYNFGGDGIGVQRFSQALARRNHHVTVLQDINAFNSLNRGAEPCGEEDSDGVEVIRLRSMLGILSPLLTQQTGRPVIQGRRIREILNKGRFDVVNFHNISLVGGPGVLSAGSALKLYMAHEHWLVCPSHVLWRHNREACTGRECMRCLLHFGRPPQLWRYTGYLERQLKHVDAFIAMSEFSRDKHRDFGFRRKMEVVNYFLPDVSRHDQALECEVPHPRPYFFFVGRLERIKGLDDIIPVFRDYKDADLLIAGEGEYAPTLKRLAAGVPGVRFLGRLAPDTLNRYYRHALALIAPTAGFETFGIVLIEAFRQSTPVIARRIGPFPEILRRCGGGELFSGPDELIKAMRRIQNDPGLRQTLARSAHEGFVKNWSEGAVIPQYLEVIRKTALAKGRTDVVRKLEAGAVA